MRLTPLFTSCVILLAASATTADPGTAFTYQGFLRNGNSPFSGIASLRFTLYDAASGGSVVGTAITRQDQLVAAGTMVQTLDFGAQFSGEPRYLAVEVDLDGGTDEFAALGDRIALLPTPYAIYSTNAGTLDGVDSTGFATSTHSHALSALSGAVTDAQVPDNITVNQAANAGTLDGVDSTGFATATHTHVLSALSGAVTDAQVPDSITINQATNAGTLDGVDSTGFATSTHSHALSALSGAVTDSQVPDNITVDQATNAGTLDGVDSTGFATAAHAHVLSALSGSVTDAQVPDNITVSQATNAGTLDGVDSTGFATAAHAHELSALTGAVTDAQVPDNITVNEASNAGTLDGVDSTGFATSSHFHSSLAASDGTPSNALSVNANGNVGINDSTPTYLLDVAGTTRIVGDLYVESASRTAVAVFVGEGVAVAETFVVTSDDESVTRFAVNNDNGRVGIGTFSPSALLHLSGVAGTDGIRFPDGTTQTTAYTGTTPVISSLSASDGTPATALSVDEAGEVGIGTTTPAYPLEVSGTVDNMARIASSALSGTWLRLMNTSNGGTTWRFISTGASNSEGAGKLLVSGEASGVRATIEEASGDVGFGSTNPETRLWVEDSINGSDTDYQAYVGTFHNGSTASSADGIRISHAHSASTTTNNYIQFCYGAGATSFGTAAGAVQGNASGGVSYSTSGSDFAELLPMRDPAEVIHAGDVVGVHGGLITRETTGADWVMVVSSQAGFLGNWSDDEAGKKAVAFTGQVPVRVRGSARRGDYLVASGFCDGTARAVAPDQLTAADAALVLGRAWSEATGEGIQRVNCVVGVPQANATAAALIREIEARDRKLEALETRAEETEARLRAIEATLARD
jgi:hypothetical protein